MAKPFYIQDGVVSNTEKKGASSYTQLFDVKKWTTDLLVSYGLMNGDPCCISGATKLGYYGSFEDYTQQVSSGTTSANLVTISGTSSTNGVAVISGSQITYSVPGTYVLNFLGQFFFSGGASNYNITVWYAKNGVAVSGSSYTFTTTGSQGNQTLANLEDIITVNSGDYIQIYWWAAAAGVTLSPTVAGSNPTRPASPSVNINTWKIA